MWYDSFISSISEVLFVCNISFINIYACKDRIEKYILKKWNEYTKITF